MGKYTRYWEAYSRERVRRGPRILAGLAAAVLVRLGLGSLELCPSWVLDVLLFGACILWGRRLAGRDYYEVTCPECGTVYLRTELGIEQCPKCGLLFLHPGR